MSHTVIGIFEQAVQAEDAKAYLIANGFDDQDIDIHTIAGSNYGNMPVTEDENIGDRISHFFSSLFDNKDEARSHAEAARRATTVTVNTTTEEETKQAVQVLDNFGAVDVDNFIQGTEPVGTTTAEETNAPLDTDLINTAILDTDILGGTPDTGSSSLRDDDALNTDLPNVGGGILRRSRVADRSRKDIGGGENTNIADL